jgi:hypothetical protein
MAPGDCGDHAVHHAPWRDPDPAAFAIDARGAVEVCDHIEWQHLEPQEKAPKVPFPLVGARPGEHLHDDWLGYGHRTVSRDELCETPVDRAPRCPVVFDPG